MTTWLNYMAYYPSKIFDPLLQQRSTKIVLRIIRSQNDKRAVKTNAFQLRIACCDRQANRPAGYGWREDE